MVLPPGLFSTMTVVFKLAPKADAMVRAMRSVGPPGGYGTTNEIGRLGNCASAAGTAIGIRLKPRTSPAHGFFHPISHLLRFTAFDFFVVLVCTPKPGRTPEKRR